MRVIVLSVLLAFVVTPACALAEFVGVSAMVSLESKPKSARLMLRDSGGEISGFKAFQREAGEQGLYQFAVSGVRDTMVESSDAWLLLEFSQGAPGVVELSWGADIFSLPQEPEQLRDSVSKLQGTARKLQQDYQQHLDEIKRAKSDLEIVASVDRIIELEEFSEHTEQELEMINADIKLATEALKSLAREPAPKNFGSRQSELTTQLAEIATLVQDTESEEHMRKTKSQEEMRHIDEVIELTSFESLSELQKELQVLQERRLRIQSKLGFTDAELDDYTLW